MSGEGGGSIAPLCLSIHNKKPDIIVLTETRVEDEAFDGKKHFGDINFLSIVRVGGEQGE